MSKKSKANKAAEPAIRPPGRVLTGGHGPQHPVLAETPVDRLRKRLGLTPTCDFEQVCSDAEAEIARLRRELQERPEAYSVK